ncbi:MAG: hypothetical protein AAF960_20080 [Bacteroidota bacterium]
MKSYILDNDWKVYKEKNKYFIEVRPIKNSIFKYHETVEIEEEIFLDIVNGENQVKNLFKKFGLHKIIMAWNGKPLKGKRLKNTENKYYGGGWLVQREGKKYFIEYLAASQGGKVIKREIDEKIYLVARSGKVDLPELIKRFNLY